MNLSPELLNLLRCPLCHPPSPLSPVAEGTVLRCAAGHSFPLTEGFPDLRPDDLKAPAPAAQQK
ncbi:Trm112 family protein [Armatimonas rosea]|uniref:Uncharacterized protein YbaR (Trm112 family) n=1 Tax=Armatimonas rosea TaxID=685828 RepID=A0A7W9SKI0_ARMRO|nr:Trm112 family protein [Armatimonas rosea]MBB6048307.1 uncharacterized protein YbaR (Trm112 family) [Armatimonas rosea]